MGLDICIYKDKIFLNQGFFFVIPFVDEGDNEAEEVISDALDFWGLQFGFGTEFFLAPQFSIGGEFGMYIYFWNVENESTYSEGSFYQEINREKLSANLSLTRSSISLNYYY